MATIPAANNYKFSADVLCNHNMPLGEYLNIFQVTSGGTPGSRQFALWRNIDNQKLHFTVGQGQDKEFFNFDCEHGSWVTFSLQVREVEGSPGTLRHVWSLDGVKITEKSMDSSEAFTSGDLAVFLSFSQWKPATQLSVKNFFYQTLDDCNVDPCENLDNCQTIINGCEYTPVRNRV